MKNKSIIYNLLPIVSFFIAWLIGSTLNFFVEGAFFSLYLLMILFNSFYTKKTYVILLTIFSIIKILYFDLYPAGIFIAKDTGDLIRLGIFMLGASLIIEIVYKLRDAIQQNQKSLEIANNAVKAKQELLGIVSHDLRNPLGTIIMNTELLKRNMQKLTNNEKAIIMCDAILRSSNSMKVLISDLLELSKLEAGNLKLNITTFNINELMERVQEQMKPILKSKSVHLDLKYEKNKFISCDFEKILRVICNLLGNSVKFSQEEETVELAVSSTLSTFLFVIKDHGPGIQQEQLSQIFEKFWQSGLQANKGAGLGLAIAKNIVEAHRGSIWVESELGHGSSFFFNVPQKIA
jgi:signal transduction histidine kinase